MPESHSKPFLPYGRQTISEADITAVVDVLRSPFLTQGPAVPAFEQAVAAKVSARHGVAVNSATSALHIACLALGVTEGDTVWTTPNTFVASANCARYCGAAVDFVDIDPETFNLCAIVAECRNGLVVPAHRPERKPVNTEVPSWMLGAETHRPLRGPYGFGGPSIEYQGQCQPNCYLGMAGI